MLRLEPENDEEMQAPPSVSFSHMQEDEPEEMSPDEKKEDSK